ncbi:hypothetical protein GCM10011512_17150 [Tersicoccus solisilvae]|uniref:Uncharacterized protein n=1 Tax=Tersicoccus solisilvae TaxID=1882339 RepID=A0ABQ1P511_9MICC|nr:hypothetical protein [Tersicoccus solisilvae]GGC90699.1 hypothetical protein GCM10011512_17150 [Tersicoccus solisilvae]
MQHGRTAAPVRNDGALGDLVAFPAAGTAAAVVPTHCGQPMRQRRLDFTATHDGANQVIAQAALEGRRVLACDCGFLLELPVAGEAVLVPDDTDPALFASFFGRRVLAAAGHAEAAEWDLDRSRDGGAGSGHGAVEGMLVAHLRHATHVLEAELLLALANRVPLDAIAREAGIDETEIRVLLERHGVTGIEAAHATEATTAPARGDVPASDPRADGCCPPMSGAVPA